MSTSFSHMTGARQTMSSWARVIESHDELPEFYRNAYQALVRNRPSFPYTVLVPNQLGPRHSRSSERLLCDLGDTFYILEPSGAQVATIGYTYAKLSSLEVGNILLYSWFAIHGVTTDGNPAGVQVEFNEANLRLLEPFLIKMRPALRSEIETVHKDELEKFDSLSSENFKLMSFARQSLRPGARVVQFIYQPALRKRLVSLFGRSLYRTVHLAHLAVLTDQEVILLGDAERITARERSRYGGVRQYLPLSSLAALDLEQQPDDIVSLTFRTSTGLDVGRFFDAARLPEIEKFKKALETSPQDI